jgi:hypothetical protein
MKRGRLWLAAPAVGLVLFGAAGIAAVSGQEASDVSSDLVTRVAEKLGIQPAELEEAIDSARTEEIAERVASGELTQEQADALNERIASDEVPALSLGFGHGPGGRGGHMLGADHEAIAGFLGITVDELRTQLQADGATLASVAEAHGQSRDALKGFLLSEAQARLDERVTAGDITQEEADEKLAEIESNLDAMIDAEGLGPGFGPGPHGDFPGERPDDATPESTPTATAS